MRTDKRSNFARVFLTFVLLCSFNFTAQAEPSRALKIIATDPVTKQTGEVGLYNKSVAVIIGIDQYANLPADKQLTYAVKDAKGVADVLKRQYKFDQIITLYNKDATRKSITKLLEVELPKQLGEQDALFIFWAGHGNQQSSREGDIGYLIPYDGDPNDITANITMTEIRDTISKVIPAKHIFYVMDACYSGLLADTRSVDRTPRRDLAYLQDMTKERVRQVLTAGGKNQEVLDGGANGHSVFTGRLIELLEKAGDFITANEIQAIIKEKVNGDARARSHNQTPTYAPLSGNGDFVFIPSLEQKVADSQAEIAKLEAELKQLDVAAAAAKLSASQAEADHQRREADIAKKAIEGKLKAEQLRQEQLAAEQRQREAEAAERQRLLAAKGQDDVKLAALKAQADARRKNTPTAQAGEFPTVESAVAEIKRLNARINAIEAGYEKSIVKTRKQVSLRYAAQLAAVSKMQPDEFEKSTDFKVRQGKQRSDLITQRDAELARMTATALAAAETAPLRESIQALAEREYTIGLESIVAELGVYNADKQQFAINLRSKTPAIHLAMNGNVPMSISEAKTFKQQWVAGLVRTEAKIKLGSATFQIALANDADNKLITLGSVDLLSETAWNELLIQEKKERAYRPEMIKIPFTTPFLMAKTEVTQAQWRAVMGNNPSKFKKCDNCPVENVSWDDTQIYLQKLNTKTGKQYRLPTEAESEFACYGGNITEYCGSNDVDAVAWTSNDSNSPPHPAGQKQANGYGLYDMSGNVWEWCQDWFDSSQSGHVLRGGSRYISPSIRYAERRDSYTPTYRSDDIGFRVTRTLP